MFQGPVVGALPLTSHEAIAAVHQVRDLGPFAAELVVIRNATGPDAISGHERRLDAEVAESRGPGARPGCRVPARAT